ncbi:DNA-binding transcriptional regulator YhcF (GntR family) [Aquimarina sp. EL_43]|uniref:GntR family transcriptional regulator n=1 Tax=Aquimarina TaxID=290174 RepID=UPI0004721A59|nr:MULTISPECIES: GntR family transcriptional regulator [Aquimarina]MBG6128897.1 DNA-binding transcriptional regulator YhcF (GntR family) [Aquimarina sp. EL_35]MBG6149961.1 DNA-binding transcriptional regulator YhcF (GntR family) [Aquimarina sp. EL_32]MBG6167352.1 DNA-binding transcriptional regulator YhcF (GntR family) [Aquimarina sp. EL_43]
MDFDNSKPIYLQIVDVFYENILVKKWQEGERIPSVREIAVMVEVNPNTAIRAFTYLQEQEVIYNKRGIGYFVSENGYNKVLDIKRKEFMEDLLPDIFKKMRLLDIKFEEVKDSFNQYLNNIDHENK